MPAFTVTDEQVRRNSSSISAGKSRSTCTMKSNSLSAAQLRVPELPQVDSVLLRPVEATQGRGIRIGVDHVRNSQGFFAFLAQGGPEGLRVAGLSSGPTLDN